MSRFPGSRADKPARRGLFRGPDSNSGDEIPQRHRRTVHATLIVVPTGPLTAVSFSTETVLLAASVLLAAAVARMAWRFVYRRRKSR